MNDFYFLTISLMSRVFLMNGLEGSRLAGGTYGSR